MPLTSPPPRTRSREAIPVAIRVIGAWLANSARGSLLVVVVPPSGALEPGRLAWDSSERLFHSWHTGQRPSHLGLSPPQAEHT